MSAGRHLVVIAGILVLAEGTLRGLGPLPSLSVTTAPFEPSERPAVLASGPDVAECVDAPGTVTGPAPRAWEAEFAGAEPALRLLVAGDSMVLGPGVRPEQTAAWRIGNQVATELGRQVTLVNAGLNAAGYCGVIRAVHHHLDEASVDAVVVALFADDLEQHALTLVNGTLRADPHRLEPGPMRTFLSHSFLANAVWFAGLKWALVEQKSTPAWVDRGPRLVPQKTVDNLVASIRHLEKRVAPTWALLGPTGLPSCPEQPSPTSECGWLVDDLDTMSASLAQEAEFFVDLQGVWGDEDALASEVDSQKQSGRIAVHPNAAGHQKIAAALLPQVLEKLSQAPSSVGD